MSLTLEERAKIADHLGYPGITQGLAIALGVPAASHPRFALEAQMSHLVPEVEVVVRRNLAECECILDQLSGARRTRIQASAVANVGLRGPEELAELERQYTAWTNRLADSLGAIKNPFSLTHQALGGEIMVVND